MRAIKHVLTERFYAWEDAVKLAEKDPEVNLSGDGPAFTPSEYYEGEEVAGEQEQQFLETVEETAEKAEPAAAAAAEGTPDATTIPSSKPQSEAPRL
jgi:large subunit ribosomal protein L47